MFRRESFLAKEKAAPEFSRTLCGEIRARSRAHLRRAPRVLIRRRRGRQTMRPFGWGAFLSTASGRLLEVRPAFVPALCFFPPDAVLRFLSSSFNIAPPCVLFRRAAFYYPPPPRRELATAGRQRNWRAKTTARELNGRDTLVPTLSTHQASPKIAILFSAVRPSARLVWRTRATRVPGHSVSLFCAFAHPALSWGPITSVLRFVISFGPPACTPCGYFPFPSLCPRRRRS